MPIALVTLLDRDRQGLPLKLLLDKAGPLAAARYVAFPCADDFDADPYYESIDLIDGYYP